MNTTPKIESTLSGKFSDIIDFLSSAGADEADQLARRAVGIIVATDGPQTGEEANTDPFVANMLASAALVTISENLKHYPFVSNSADFDQAAMLGSTSLDPIDSARELIERAEALLGAEPRTFAGAPEPDSSTPAGVLAAVVDDAICRIFEETGQLPAAVFVVILDDSEATADDGASPGVTAGEPEDATASAAV